MGNFGASTVWSDLFERFAQLLNLIDGYLSKAHEIAAPAVAGVAACVLTIMFLQMVMGKINVGQIFWDIIGSWYR